MKRLSDVPEKYPELIKLIQREFSYPKEFSFEVDFYSLIKRSNWSNCWIKLDPATQKPIAHIGVRKREILLNGKTYPIHLLGGICVDKKFQGHGLFRELFEKLDLEYQQTCGFLLWSNLTELYGKFGMELCGSQYQLNSPNQGIPDFQPTIFKNLSTEEKDQVKKIYFHTPIHFPTLKREEEHWQDLESITTSTLYIKKSNNQIVAYYFKGKGADLGGVIHEYGFTKDEFEKSWKDFTTLNQVWTPMNIAPKNSTAQFQFMFKPKDPKLFESLKQASGVRDNIFGPEHHASRLNHFFISGLDSV